jgi:Flp pilus assembly protein TadD
MIMRTLSLTILVIVMTTCISTRLSAQKQIDWTLVHTKTMESINALYNLDFQIAEKRCSETISIAPNDPRGHFFKAMVYYYRYTLVSNTESDYKKFVMLSQKTSEVCDRLLNQNENNAQAYFYKGGILGYRGLTKFNRKDITGAFWDGKEALSALEDALKLDPKNADIQMGFGLFNYLITQAPSSIQPMLRAIGLKGDKIAGLKQLENAAQNGIYCKYEAKRWLSIFYNWEEMYNRSALQYKSLIADFPANSWIRVAYISTLVNGIRNPAEALQQTKDLEKNNHSTQQKPLSQAYLLSGIASFNLCDFEQAKLWCNKTITLDVDSQHVENAHWLLGRCYEITGNRNEAWNNYVKSQRNKSEYLQPLTSSEITLIKIENHIKSKKFQSIVDLEDLINDTKWNNDDNVLANYYLGRAYFETNQYEKAEKVLSQISQMKTQNKHWIKPYTLYRLGQVYIARKKRDDAKAIFDKLLDDDKVSSDENLKKLISKELYNMSKK